MKKHRFKEMSKKFNHAQESFKSKISHNIILLTIYKFVIIIIGFTVLLAGILMLVLPGPGLLTILGGLAILSLEIPYFHHIYRNIKIRIVLIWRKIKNKYQALKK